MFISERSPKTPGQPALKSSNRSGRTLDNVMRVLRQYFLCLFQQEKNFECRWQRVRSEFSVELFLKSGELFAKFGNFLAKLRHVARKRFYIYPFLRTEWVFELTLNCLLIALLPDFRNRQSFSHQVRVAHFLGAGLARQHGHQRRLALAEPLQRGVYALQIFERMHARSPRT